MLVRHRWADGETGAQIELSSDDDLRIERLERGQKTTEFWRHLRRFDEPDRIIEEE